MAEAATLKFIENAFDLFENRFEQKKYWLQYQQIENLTHVINNVLQKIMKRVTQVNDFELDSFYR